MIAVTAGFAAGIVLMLVLTRLATLVVAVRLPACGPELAAALGQSIEQAQPAADNRQRHALVRVTETTLEVVLYDSREAALAVLELEVLTGDPPARFRAYCLAPSLADLPALKRWWWDRAAALRLKLVTLVTTAPAVEVGAE
jgi:hypothetical protein